MKSCVLQTDMLPIYLSRKDKARHTCIFSYLDTLCCFSSIVSSWLSGGLIRNRQLKLRLLLGDGSGFQPMKIDRPWKIITWIMPFLPTDTRLELLQLLNHTFWNQLRAPTYKSDNNQNEEFPEAFMFLKAVLVHLFTQSKCYTWVWGWLELCISER